MDRKFPESDWKVFRELRVLALDRFCERVLSELGSIASDARRTHHERYLAVYNLIQQQNDDLADAFDNPRRSMLVTQLARIRAQELLTDEEFSRFGLPTRESVDGLLEIESRYRSVRSPRLVQSETAADFIKVAVPEILQDGNDERPSM